MKKLKLVTSANLLLIIILMLTIPAANLFSYDNNNQKNDKLLDESGWVDSVGFKQQKMKIGVCSYLHYSNDGKYIYTFSSDTTFRKWDAETGVILYEKNFHKNVFDFALNEENENLAAISIHGTDTVYIYNLLMDSTICKIQSLNGETLAGNDNYINTKIQFNPKDSIIITCLNYIFRGVDGPVTYGKWRGIPNSWDYKTGQYKNKINSDAYSVNLLFSPNYEYYCLSSQKVDWSQYESDYKISYKHNLTLYESKGNNGYSFYNDSVDYLPVFYYNNLAFSHDSRLLVCQVPYDKIDSVMLYDTKKKQIINQWAMINPFGMILSNDDKLLITGHYITGDYDEKDTIESLINFRLPELGTVVGSIQLDNIYFAGRFVTTPDSTGILIAGTDGYLRIYSIPKIHLGVQKSKIMSFETFSIHAFPNPFSESITIEYTLPEPSPVKISLYDVFGNEVDVIDRNDYQQGLHRVEYSGNKLSQGMYYLRVQAGTFISTEKVLYVK